MLKALQNLLKGDIIKEKIPRGLKFMANEKYTLSEINVIMWLKALYDFVNPDFPNDTFDDKMMKFRYKTADIETEDLQSVLEKLMNQGIVDLSTGRCEFTLKGITIMKALSAIKDLSDKTIQAIVNGTIDVTEYVKEHLIDILEILGATLI